MSVLRTFVKDPDATLDYAIDWSLWLKGDTITAAVWTVAAGATKELVQTTSTKSTVWISGGTLATTYAATCHITTLNGLVDDRTINISIVSK